MSWPSLHERKRKRRYYNKPRFGWGIPNTIDPPEGTSSWDRDVPRAFGIRWRWGWSQRAMDRMETMWSQPKGVAWAILRKVARILSGEAQQETQPPRKIYTYTINCD